MRIIEIVSGVCLIALAIFIQYRNFRSQERKARRSDLTLYQQGSSEWNFMNGVKTSIILALLGAMLISGGYIW